MGVRGPRGGMTRWAERRGERGSPGRTDEGYGEKKRHRRNNGEMEGEKKGFGNEDEFRKKYGLNRVSV